MYICIIHFVHFYNRMGTGMKINRQMLCSKNIKLRVRHWERKAINSETEPGEGAQTELIITIGILISILYFFHWEDLI